jgi:hypothetical protein
MAAISIPLVRIVGAILIVAISNSCENNPAVPSNNIKETWTGTAAVGGTPTQSQRVVTMSAGGNLIVTLENLTPPLPSGKFAALAIGQLQGSPCDYATPASVQSLSAEPGTVINVPTAGGTYCVSVFDKGDFTVAEAFQVSISHP